MRERLFVQLSTVVMRIISKSFEVSARKITHNNILVAGNNLYGTLRSIERTNDYLLLTDLPAFVSIFDNVYTLQYNESLTESLFLTSNNGPFMTLQNAITELSSQKNYNCCLLTIGINATLTPRELFSIYIMWGSVELPLLKA